MWRYTVRRLLQLIPLLLGTTFLIFTMVFALPGDKVQRLSGERRPDPARATYLIDRYNLLVFPLLLGAGQKLFSDTDKDTRKLKLVDSEAFSNGIQKNIFDVIH